MILHCKALIFGLLTLSSLSSEGILGLSINDSQRRQKRLVFGVSVLLEDQQDYNTLQYQSTIVSSHFCNEGLLRLLERTYPGQFDPSEQWNIDVEHVKNMVYTHCPLDQTRAICGGAAITEFAVQTSCHCIARFDKKIRDNYGVATPYNGWEDMLFLYIGALKFSRSYIPYASKNFILHQNCRLVANTTISQNVGIIALRYKLAAGTKFVGPSTMKEISLQWHYIIQKQAVCLIVGWGSAYMESGAAFGLPSYELRRSWRVMRSYSYCFETHRSVDGFMDAIRNSIPLYKELATWTCSTDFGKHNSKVSIIDSGSPISCVNGWYFGISNWAMEAVTVNNEAFTITSDNDVVYSLFENSWDYRRAFNHYLYEIRQIVTYPEPKTPKSYVFAQKETPRETYPEMELQSQISRQHGYLAYYTPWSMLCFTTSLLFLVNYSLLLMATS